MAYCIKTYKSYEPKESKFATRIIEFGSDVLDSHEMFINWPKKKNLRKCLLPVAYLYSCLVFVFLLSVFVIFFKMLVEKKIFFQEGKDYEVFTEYENTRKIKIFYSNEINQISIAFKIDRKFIFNKENCEFYSYYPKYFVDDIKTYRKLKLKKIGVVI